MKSTGLYFGLILCLWTAGLNAQVDRAGALARLSDARNAFQSENFTSVVEEVQPALDFLKNEPALQREYAEAVLMLGKSLYFQEKYKSAQPHLEEAVAVGERIYPEGDLQTAGALHYLALCNYGRSQFDAAVSAGLKALELRRKLLPPHHVDIAETLRIIGNIHISIGRYSFAVKYYEEALAIEKICSGEESTRTADVLGNLGYAYMTDGHLLQAVAAQEQALLIRKKILPPDHPDVALSCHILGMIHKSLHRYDLSLQYLEQALEIKRKNYGETHLQIASSLSEIGRLRLLRRDYQRALSCFEKSNEIMIALNLSNSTDYTHICADLGGVHYRLGNYPEAALWHQKSADLWKKAYKGMSSPYASALTQLGQSRLALGDRQTALACFEEAKKNWEAVFSPDDPLIARADAGIGSVWYQAYLREGADSLLRKSRWAYRAAVRGLERKFKTEPSAEVQFKNLAEAAPVYEKALRSEIAYFHKHPEAREALENAWQYSEAMHSFQLYAAVQESRARRFSGVPETELRQDSLLGAQITGLERKRQNLIQGGRTLTDSLVLDASARLSRLKEEREVLRTQFEQKYPDYARLRLDIQRLTLEKACGMLHSGQTMLEYFTGDSAIYVFTLHAEGASVTALPRDFPLQDWIGEFRAGITEYFQAGEKTDQLYESSVRKYAAAAEKLYQKLLAPVVKDLETDLIIIPGEGLSNLPFEALLSGKPSDISNFNTYPFLVRGRTVQYAYSAAMLREMSAPKSPAGMSGELLAFAPFYDGDTTVLAARLRREDALRLGLASLPYSGEEILRVKEQVSGLSELYHGKEATKQKFLEKAPYFKILHLATHGKADHLAGEFSFLAFSSREAPEAGFISVGELYNLKINADLVTLSACETALGEAWRGEGIVSLARAFAYAGAASILASLWSVNDKSTMRLMNLYYKNLRQKMPKSRALGEAKRTFMKDNPQQAHPFFWAGFIGIGGN